MIPSHFTVYVGVSRASIRSHFSVYVGVSRVCPHFRSNMLYLAYTYYSLTTHIVIIFIHFRYSVMIVINFSYLFQLLFIIYFSYYSFHSFFCSSSFHFTAPPHFIYDNINIQFIIMYTKGGTSPPTPPTAGYTPQWLQPAGYGLHARYVLPLQTRRYGLQACRLTILNISS